MIFGLFSRRPGLPSQAAYAAELLRWHNDKLRAAAEGLRLQLADTGRLLDEGEDDDRKETGDAG